MNPEELKRRTKAFSVATVEFVRSLPADDSLRILGRQLLKSGTSVGANYRAACRARSKSDMIGKLKIVEEEADECGFWLEILEESGYVSPSLIGLKNESYELLAISVASIKTFRQSGNGP